jgi:hypothetical protein
MLCVESCSRPTREKRSTESELAAEARLEELFDGGKEQSHLLTPSWVLGSPAMQ